MRLYKKLVSCSLVCVSLWVLTLLPADGYVLRGQHVLELMIKEISLPQRLFLSQTLTLFTSDFFSEKTVYEQWIRYQLPEQFRSDIESEDLKQIHVVSGDQSLTIIDGAVVAESEMWMDHYKDIFFYRSRKKLVMQLESLGIDFSVTSLNRYEGTICYVIGAQYPDDPVPQLWISKDTFRPIRWIVELTETDTGLKRSEFLFKEWTNYHQSWYPAKIELVEDQQIIRSIEVRQIEINPVFSKELFDIEHLKAYYSSKPQDKLPETQPDDIEKRIEEFKKIYE